jgi:hypothetical protein
MVLVLVLAVSGAANLVLGLLVRSLAEFILFVLAPGVAENLGGFWKLLGVRPKNAFSDHVKPLSAFGSAFIIPI